MKPAAASPLRALLPLFAVQFFCWSGMFLMWIGAYPVITLAILHLPPGGAATRIGMITLACCFAWYATLSGLLAFLLPRLTRRVEPALLLAAATAIGACGLAGLGLIERPELLVVSFTALAVGWCALSNLPYTIAGKLVPEEEIEHWFRVFAFSSILPQLAVTALIIAMITVIDAYVARHIMFAAGGAMMGGSLLAVLLHKQLSGAS
jgi:maltose/moltooligosaccharide transporter